MVRDSFRRRALPFRLRRNFPKAELLNPGSETGHVYWAPANVGSRRWKSTACVERPAVAQHVQIVKAFPSHIFPKTNAFAFFDHGRI
jgi:hypothetical protein